MFDVVKSKMADTVNVLILTLVFVLILTPCRISGRHVHSEERPRERRHPAQTRLKDHGTDRSTVDKRAVPGAGPQRHHSLHLPLGGYHHRPRAVPLGHQSTNQHHSLPGMSSDPNSGLSSNPNSGLSSNPNSGMFLGMSSNSNPEMAQTYNPSPEDNVADQRNEDSALSQLSGTSSSSNEAAPTGAPRDPCSPTPCKNGGQCKADRSRGTDSFDCACPLQYRGKFCHEEMQMCQTLGCIKIKDCVSTPAGSVCICAGGEVSGRMCLIDTGIPSDWEKIGMVVSENTVRAGEVILGTVLSLIFLVTVVLVCICHKVGAKRKVLRANYKEAIDAGHMPEQEPPDWLDICKDMFRTSCCCTRKESVFPDDYFPKRSSSRSSSKHKTNVDEIEDNDALDQLLNANTATINQNSLRRSDSGYSQYRAVRPVERHRSFSKTNVPSHRQSSSQHPRKGSSRTNTVRPDKRDSVQISPRILNTREQLRQASIYRKRDCNIDVYPHREYNSEVKCAQYQDQPQGNFSPEVVNCEVEKKASGQQASYGKNARIDNGNSYESTEMDISRNASINDHASDQRYLHSQYGDDVDMSMSTTPEGWKQRINKVRENITRQRQSLGIRHPIGRRTKYDDSPSSSDEAECWNKDWVRQESASPRKYSLYNRNMNMNVDSDVDYDMYRRSYTTMYKQQTPDSYWKQYVSTFVADNKNVNENSFETDRFLKSPIDGVSVGKRQEVSPMHFIDKNCESTPNNVDTFKFSEFERSDSSSPNDFETEFRSEHPRQSSEDIIRDEYILSEDTSFGIWSMTVPVSQEEEVPFPTSTPDVKSSTRDALKSNSDTDKIGVWSTTVTVPADDLTDEELLNDYSMAQEMERQYYGTAQSFDGENEMHVNFQTDTDDLNESAGAGINEVRGANSESNGSFQNDTLGLDRSADTSAKGEYVKCFESDGNKLYYVSTGKNSVNMTGNLSDSEYNDSNTVEKNNSAVHTAMETADAGDNCSETDSESPRDTFQIIEANETDNTESCNTSTTTLIPSATNSTFDSESDHTIVYDGSSA